MNKTYDFKNENGIQEIYFNDSLELSICISDILSNLRLGEYFSLISTMEDINSITFNLNNNRIDHFSLDYDDLYILTIAYDGYTTIQGFSNMFGGRICLDSTICAFNSNYMKEKDYITLKDEEERILIYGYSNE